MHEKDFNMKPLSESLMDLAGRVKRLEDAAAAVPQIGWAVRARKAAGAVERRSERLTGPPPTTKTAS
jgi:imidazoleglycerol phosphate synthase glutamine amidotransferase subunit HisH